MSPRALVTGASGFVGQWVVRALLARGWSVTGARLRDGRELSVLDAGERAALSWVVADVRDANAISDAVERARPDAIFHLAGIASLGAAAEDPGRAYDVNVGGTARLLAEVVRRRQRGEIDPVVVVAGSSEQYGRHEVDEMPLTEHAALLPLTIYAASKAAQEVVSLQAARGDGIRVICTRSFNHSGAGQSETYLLPALVRRALTAHRTAAPRLQVGNLTPVRDFLHVADVAQAYCALAERGAGGEVYNVSSGRGRSVRELIELVLRHLNVRMELEPDASLQRPADVPVLVGDSAKLREATGWCPQRSVEEIIEDLARAAA